MKKILNLIVFLPLYIFGMETDIHQLAFMPHDIVRVILTEMPIQSVGNVAVVNHDFHRFVQENGTFLLHYMMQHYNQYDEPDKKFLLNHITSDYNRCTDALMICARSYDTSNDALNLFDHLYEKEKNNEKRRNVVKCLKGCAISKSE